ncbi:MAG TPA: cyclase family protein [Acidimicrobiia bacterium]
MRTITDITLPIRTGQLSWPGDPPVAVTPCFRLADGDPANVSEVRLSSHTGTHVDPPAHFLDGAATVDQLPLDALVGEATVVDLTGRPGPIGPTDLESLGLPAGTERLLMKTDNSARWPERLHTFPDDYVALSQAGAAWMVERGVRLVGIDFLSVEEYGAPGHPTHVTLLSAGVVILEGLDLSAVAAGTYELACLPLRLAGCDGAPARAVLISP